MALWSSVFLLGEILSLGDQKTKGGREENLNLTRISLEKQWHKVAIFLRGEKKIRQILTPASRTIARISSGVQNNSTLLSGL
jgi:hypothetical protein